MKFSGPKGCGTKTKRLPFEYSYPRKRPWGQRLTLIPFDLERPNMVQYRPNISREWVGFSGSTVPRCSVLLI